MDTLKRDYNFPFQIGFSLITLIGLIDLVSSLSFTLHIPLAAWHLPLAIGFTLVFSYYYTGCFKLTNRPAFFLKSSVCLVLIILLAIFIAGYFYDLSFDGQEYHQEAVYQLSHNHWNPFYETLPDSVNQAIWVNHYPKQSETSAAVIYALTGRIETGKAANLMLLIASCCLTFAFLKQHTSLNPLKVICLSALFAFNPIAVHQALTYLVDGQMASLLLCLLITCMWLYHDAGRYKLLLFAFIIIACINIKLTAIAFTGIFIIFLLMLLLFRKQRKAFWRVFIVAAVSTITAVVVVGFNPYVINTVQYHNVFYPLMGKHPVDIMTRNSPVGFPQKNRFEKMFITIFSHTDNIDMQLRDREPQLKIPFTFNKLDIKSLAYPDNRIGGFGPLFSGIFLLTLFFLILLLVYRRKDLLSSYLAGFMLMLGFSVVILEEAWWARYVPQFWFIPLLMLILMEAFDKKWIVTLKNATYIIMLINISLSIYMVTQTNILKTAEINYQLKQFKALNEPIVIDFNEFEANRVRLNEHHIPYIKKNMTGSDTSAIKIIYSRALVKTSRPLPKPPLPWLIKLEQRIKSH